MKEVSEKITERIRKLIRLKESATHRSDLKVKLMRRQRRYTACLWNTTSPCLILPVRIHKTG